MKFIYDTIGTCSKQIILDIDEQNDIIKNVSFIGGCSGNTQGLSSLLKNMDVDTVDLGVPVLSMHAPFEITSKLDVYYTYKAFAAFNK